MINATESSERATADVSGDPLQSWDPQRGFFFVRDGAGIITEGARLSATVSPGSSQRDEILREAQTLITQCHATDLVVGAIPFDGTVPAYLRIPTLIQHVSERDFVPTEARALVPNDTSPIRRLSVHAFPSADAYAAMVMQALRMISNDKIRKVVLSRTLQVEVERPIDVRAVIAFLRKRDTHGYTFSTCTSDDPHSPLFVGATPEMLISRQGNRVSSMALGGSATRSSDSDIDKRAAERLLTSTKDHHEHALVVQGIAAVLAPYCDELTIPKEPHITGTATVWHLATPIEGRLKSSAPDALTLALALHPTPAVCGTPTDRALTAISALEPVSRGLYAGTIGWVNGQGDGEWAVALRCAEIDGNRATLYAGAGIVNGSDPVVEVQETDAKFRALLDALAMYYEFA